VRRLIHSTTLLIALIFVSTTNVVASVNLSNNPSLDSDTKVIVVDDKTNDSDCKILVTTESEEDRKVPIAQLPDGKDKLILQGKNVQQGSYWLRGLQILVKLKEQDIKIMLG